MAKHNETGAVGETIAANWLEKKGFRVIDRNYRKKWGELDIVAQKDKVLHFVEVKTVSRRSFGGPPSPNIYGGTSKFEQEINNYRPEDGMHKWKVRRLRRAIQTYLAGKYKGNDPLWQFHLICVFLDQERRVAKVKFVKNLIL